MIARSASVITLAAVGRRGTLRNQVGDFAGSHRLNRLLAIAAIIMGLLFVKVLVAILAEYRWYFPADFDRSAFLGGRRHTFLGVYRVAFYAHVISGPIAVVLAALLMISGKRSWMRNFHRCGGKLQLFVVLGIVAPSGLIMAQESYAGRAAVLGFSALACATGVAVTVAAYSAMRKRFGSHRRWSLRCFLLLTSPLLLRVMNGAAIATGLESDLSYRLSAWLSWLVPLAVSEFAWHYRAMVRWAPGPQHSLAEF